MQFTLTATCDNVSETERKRGGACSIKIIESIYLLLSREALFLFPCLLSFIKMEGKAVVESEQFKESAEQG